MSVFKTIAKTIVSPLEMLKPTHSGGRLAASIMVVAAAICFGSVIAPLAYYAWNKNLIELNLWKILIMLVGSILTFAAACGMFYFVSRLFKKGVGFKEIVSTWGFSYLPNLLCIIMYSALQIFAPFTIASGFFAFVINTFFILLLAYKALYYFIEMKVVLFVTAKELFISTIIIGAAFLLLMAGGFAVGIQVPML